jgi:hypothetical protein
MISGVAKCQKTTAMKSFLLSPSVIMTEIFSDKNIHSQVEH